MSIDKILFIRQYAPKQKYVGSIPLCTQFGAYQYQTNIDRAWKHFKLNLGLGDSVFSNEFRNFNFNQYHLIIVEELFSWSPSPLLKFLRTRNKDARILYWLRNTLFIEKYKTGITSKNINSFLKLQDELNFQIISFDKRDCEQYGLLYAPQCILNIDWSDFDQANYDLKQDIFWVGKDKGRLGELLYLKKQFERLGMSCMFRVLPQKKRRYSKEVRPLLLDRELPYSQIIKMDLQSKAILDIVVKNQMGLTYRAIEAMRLRKKLITTFKEIQNYDFYRRENIFIIGKDHLEWLPEFLNSPYQDIPSNIVDGYSFQGMIQYIYRKMQWDLTELE